MIKPSANGCCLNGLRERKGYSRYKNGLVVIGPRHDKWGIVNICTDHEKK